ncbi:MAG: glycine cleavage system protein GcvH [Rhodothermia bacterium]|nr:glycine cleavage system protein GcvH [Rhodothermia bacterium]
MTTIFPEHLRYTKDHEWVLDEDNGIFKVGITDFAQRELGDIVFVELPLVGDTFGAEEEFGTVEAVKTVSQLFMPIAGEVVEINTAISDDPEVINSDPYGEGWMIKIRPQNADDLQQLLTANTYQSLVSA